MREKKILLLRRSSKVGTYKGCWAGVSGYLDAPDATEQAWIELHEELGIGSEEAVLEVVGEPLTVADHKTGRVWLVHPHRFSLSPHCVPCLDWEHVEMRWSLPKEIRQVDTVPGLWEAWCRVRTGFD